MGAPAVYTLPAVKPVEVKPVEVKAPVVTYAAAPAVYHHAPLVHHQIVHQPVSTHTDTVQVGTHVNTYALPHVFGAGAPILGGVPVVAAAKPAEEAAVAE